MTNPKSPLDSNYKNQERTEQQREEFRNIMRKGHGLPPQLIKLKREDIEGSYNLTDEALTRDLPPQPTDVSEGWEEDYELMMSIPVGNKGKRVYRVTEKENIIIKDFIAKVRAEGIKETLETLLKHGHGGGNWRRLITMEMEKLDTIGRN